MTDAPGLGVKHRLRAWQKPAVAAELLHYVDSCARHRRAATTPRELKWTFRRSRCTKARKKNQAFSRARGAFALTRFSATETANLLPDEIPVARLHDQIFLFRGQLDFVIARTGVVLFRRIPQAVLIAQLFIDGGINVVDGLLLGYFKKSPARFA